MNWLEGQEKLFRQSSFKWCQNLEGGILAELLVQEGEEVEEGQILLKLDDTEVASRFQEREQLIRVLLARSERLRAEAEGGELSFSGPLKASDASLVNEQRQLFDQRKEQLLASSITISQQIQQKLQLKEQLSVQLAQSKEQEVLAQKELAILKPLAEQGVVSEVELIKAEKGVLVARREASSIELKLPQVEVCHCRIEESASSAKSGFKSIPAQSSMRYWPSWHKCHKGMGCWKID